MTDDSGNKYQRAKHEALLPATYLQAIAISLAVGLVLCDQVFELFRDPVPSEVYYVMAVIVMTGYGAPNFILSIISKFKG